MKIIHEGDFNLGSKFVSTCYCCNAVFEFALGETTPGTSEGWRHFNCPKCGTGDCLPIKKGVVDANHRATANKTLWQDFKSLFGLG